MFLSSSLSRRTTTVILLQHARRQGPYHRRGHGFARALSQTDVMMQNNARLFSSSSNNNNNNNNNKGGNRITVKKPQSQSQQQQQQSVQVQQLQLIRTNLQQHLDYISSKDPTKVSPKNLISNDPSKFESGIMPHDWTDSMVDLSSAFDARLHLPNAPKYYSNEMYEEATPLSTQMISYMAVRSQPITVAEFMRQALCHEKFGYYTNPPSSMSQKDDDDLFHDDNDDDDDDDNDDDWDDDPTMTASKSDYIIGRRGDFVTAPEVSQVFGEMLAVWFVTQYTNPDAMMSSKSSSSTAITNSPPNTTPSSKKTKNPIRIVEVGPGKGTLLQDVLRSMAWLKPTMAQSITEIHLVEQSAPMRQEQRKKLQALMTKSKNTDDVHHDDNETKEQKETTSSKNTLEFNFVFHGDNDDDHENNTKTNENTTETSNNDKNDTTTSTNTTTTTTTTTQPIHVHWHASFSNFMYFIKDHDKDNDGISNTTSATTATTRTSKMPTFVICQEFIDALPVHVFEKLESGWRERMVDVTVDDDDDDENKGENKVEDKNDNIRKEEEKKGNDVHHPDTPTDKTKKKTKVEKKTRLRLVISPSVSPACQTLLNVDENGQMEHDTSPVGSVVEVCPEGILLVQDISKLITEQGGAALIIDYGMEGSSDSLRGFSKHKQVSFLSRPGLVDVTADVDFSALRHAVNHQITSKQNNSSLLGDKIKKKIHANDDTTSAFAFGPVPQGKFLTAMGAAERVISLIENENTTDEEAEELYQALERLCLPEHMGERYKVLAIARKKDGIFAPPGF